MATVTSKGLPVELIGTLPLPGSPAPFFSLTRGDLSELTSDELRGRNIVLNIFPSLDTGVCATSVRTFNRLAAGLKESVVLAVSKDLPFAQSRFCTVEGIENVIPVSAFRNPEFGRDYGVCIAEGPLRGLLARSVVVIDPAGKVRYTELVPEITQEPNYEKALSAIRA